MHYRTIPFLIVLLASVLPWVAAAVNSKMLTYIPDVLAVLTYVWLVVRHPLKDSKLPFYFVLLFLFIGFHAFFGIVSGRGIGSGGLVSLLVLMFVFSKMLEQESSPQLAKVIARQIGIVYIVHVVFILTELLFRLAGYTDILVAIAGHVPGQTSLSLKTYKTYNSAAFLNYLGVLDISGMNSLLLGSQSASQLTLLAAFYFAPWYKDLRTMRDGFARWWWFLFALVLFPFVASMTAMAMLALLLLFLIYRLPNSKLNKPAIWFATPVLLVTMWTSLIDIFAFRLTNEHDIVEYTTAFMASPESYLELPLLDQIMGFGSNLAESHVAAADFGFGMLLYQTGFLMIGVMLASFALNINAVCTAIYRYRAGGFASEPWATVAGINIVCAIGWAISLIHYTPAIELGGRHIFALHLAASLVALKRMKAAAVPAALTATGDGVRFE